MKERIFKLFLIIVAIVTTLVLYVNSSYYIENQDWKYADGTHIGDWLGKSNFEIKGRIIYTSNGNAKIIFSFGKNLIIENTETQVRGYYVNKS